MLSRRRIARAALVAASAWSFSLQAAVLQLAPIPIEVQAPQKAAVMNLGNRGSAEVTLQVRVFRWTQAGGEDRLEPTKDVVVSPPIATVPPGQSLSVRVVRVSPGPPNAEETFRILVDELPGKKSKPAQGGALRVLMRYSVPVFYAPEKELGAPALFWKLYRNSAGEWRLSATNNGQRRAHVQALQLNAPDRSGGAVETGKEPSGYVLAGQEMSWTLKPGADFPVTPGARYRVSYRIESESFSDTVRLVQGR